MKITKEEIEEYRALSELVHKSLLRMKEIDSKNPKSKIGGVVVANKYTRKASERDTTTNLPKL